MALCIFPSLGFAGAWCVMEEVVSVDTTGNTGGAGSCYVTGKVNINDTLTTVSDVGICGGGDASVNARNLSLALTAFTAQKKIAYYLSDFSSCSEFLPRWESRHTRMSLQN